MEIEKQRNTIEGAERWLSLAGGAAALYYGLKRRGWIGSALALAGSSYLVRGLTGERRVLEYLGVKRSYGGVPYGLGLKVRRSVTIEKSAEELYAFWRNFANLPRFMENLEAVRIIDAMRSHWTVKAPAGRTVEWDAELTSERPNEMIGWRSLNGPVDHAGSVRFERAAGGRGTVVRVQLQYNPPAGRLGAGIAKLFGEDPESQIREDLRRFKELMEAGEIPTTEGQPSGRAEEARRLAVGATRPADVRRPEPVDEASVESFPASDAPSWTTGRS